MKKKPLLVFMLFIVCALLSTSAWGANNDVAFSLKSSDAVSGRLAAVSAAIPAGNPDFVLACPAAPAGLPDMIELAGEEFCLFYDDAGTTADQANRGAEHTADYWEAFVDEMGFPAPEYSDVEVKFHVRLPDSGTYCNGGVSPGSTFTTINDGCDTPPEVQPQMYQLVFGHELYHQIQLSDGGNNPASNNFDALWFHEGTARSMEDKVFEIVDHWPTALSAPFSYNGEVNDYLLLNTGNDITSDPMRYLSALWWTYYSEQCGTEMDETRRGVDAFGELWDAALVADNIAALNNALSTLGCPSFDTMFRNFTVANWTKDLTGIPDGSYNYDDEDEVGNPAPYGPLVPVNLGSIDSVTSVSSPAVLHNPYSATYYSATPDAGDCPVISVNFERTAGSGEYYHVVTQNGAAFNTHVAGSGANWTQSFLNDGVTQVTAITGGLGSQPTVEVTFSCAEPVIEIEQPNTGAPAYVGSFGSPDDIVVQVSVTDGSPTGPIVGGLANSDFSVEIGGDLALVLGGGFVQEEYFLLVNTPTQGANGPYDLEVFLEEPGTSTVIASDLEDDAVVYDNTNTDHVIITDVSGSMGWDGKMQAAKDAADLYIDASNSTDGLGLVSFSTDVVDTLDIEFGTLPHRTDAHNEVDTYVPTAATSIGDGLDEAVNLLGASPTGNARCQFTLLSDGMENQPLYWLDVQAAVVATDCPVMTVAFGADSNELLMQDIATATGGAAYYNDVYVSSEAGNGGSPDETELDLGDTYLYALCEGQGCQRLLSERGSLGYAESMTHTFTVDSSLADLTTVLDWMPYPQAPGESGRNDFELYLRSPSGVIYDPGQYAFVDNGAGYVGYQLPDPEDGEWDALVISYFDDNDKPYQLTAYGQTPVAVRLLLPAVQERATGDYMPIYAIWRPGGQVLATITPMNGISNTIALHDDGQHDDGAAGDGFFAGRYTLVNQAEEVQPVPEEGVSNPPPAEDEGGYSVQLLATDGDLVRETKGAFSVIEGDDGNGDSIPDDFIDTHCPGAPNSDADLDQLSCADEYYTGTDPNNSDTDGGGESDESEALRHGLDPFVPADDVIDAPDFVHTQDGNGMVTLTYDTSGNYQSMLAYRATGPAGPWSLIATELPLSGVYEDTGVTNGGTYYYCVQAIDGNDHWSAVVCSSEARPRIDPVLPEAGVLINDGAPSTDDPNVVLTFVPTAEEFGLHFIEGGGNPFDDITEVLISNSPDFAGASWQPFQQGIEWQLLAGYGNRTVFVKFRDENGNESMGTTGAIFLDAERLFMPVMLKQP